MIATRAPRLSVVERLRSDGRFVETLERLLHQSVASDHTTAIRCINPGHKDKRPSCIVKPSVGRVDCSCGLSLGLLELVVFLGHAGDVAAAAAWLERTFYGTSTVAASGNVGASTSGAPSGATGDREWPWYPETAPTLGWQVQRDGRFNALRVPTHLPDGSPARVKIRRDKRCGKATASIEGSGFVGMLNIPAALDLITGSGEAPPTVFLLAGETDLLAFTHHASHEGLAGLVGVSSAMGEPAAVGPEWAPVFRGVHVVVAYDNDAAGRRHGPQRAAEVAAMSPASVVSVHVPDPHKDVCDFLRGGGTVRDLLRIADAERAETGESEAAAPPAPAPGSMTSRRRPEPLADEAYHGLAGEWVRLIAPHTEAHPAAVIVTYLTLAGNAWGGGPHLEVSPGNVHHTNEFVAIVGDSSAGAKGDSLKAARIPFRNAAGDWFDTRVFHAANSTAGVIDLVRDPQYAADRTGLTAEEPEWHAEPIDPGCPDRLKRVVFTLTEFASLVRKFEVKGDTLSSTYREAWDGEPLQNTSKTNRASARTHHISSIAHVTPAELRQYVTPTEQVNGFLNRHLLVWSERAQLLPGYSAPDELAVADHVRRLTRAIEFGSAAGSIRRTEPAEALWRHVYARLVTPPAGALSTLLARGRPHVVRLSLIYAVLDEASAVDVEHLLAALAVWDYVAESYAYVFGASCCDPKSKTLLDAVHAAGGRVLHTAVHRALGNHWTTRDYELATESLATAGLLRIEQQRSDGAGRPGTVYVALAHATYQPILPIARAFVMERGA